MFSRRRIDPQDRRALEWIEALVRSRYCLGDGALVLVSSEESRVTGAPGRLTRVLFWTAPDRRHKVTLFKPPTEIGADDLPPGWLRSALIDDGDDECC